MPWVKLDDGCDEHPKLVGLSDGAFAAWVTGLLYCNRNRTDGFIPAAAAHRRLRGDGEETAEELVRAGLWERTDDGYRVHDYLDYQPSSDQARRISEARSAAGQAGAASRWQADGKPMATCHAVATGADGKCHQASMANRCPVPVPVPPSPPTPPSPSGADDAPLGETPLPPSGDGGSRARARRAASRFEPPTVEQVRATMGELGMPDRAEEWMAHYQANGWRVGRNPMRDWRAAILTWKHSGNGRGRDSPGPSSWRGLNPEVLSMFPDDEEGGT